MRVFEQKPIPEDIKASILAAAMRAPTAGNSMLYSILEQKICTGKILSIQLLSDHVHPRIQKIWKTTADILDCINWLKI